MEEEFYKIARKIFFWFFLVAFVVLLPLIIFYSLGYQFNSNLKRFQKTGVITIKSLPAGAQVYLENKKINQPTPCDIKEVLPGTYKVKLEKEGFYPYEVKVEVKSFMVSPLDAVLIPKIKDIEKIKADLDIYKFFIIEHLFGKKIIAFARDGIYVFNEDLDEIAKASPINLTEETLASIKDIKEGRNNFVFYNQKDIWLIDYGSWSIKKELTLEHIYKAAEPIRGVFFGFKDRYLIIQEGTKIIALDINIRDNSVIFEIYRLNNKDSEVYYDNSSDTLFIKDKLEPSRTFSLFKINVMKKIYEKGQD